MDRAASHTLATCSAPSSRSRINITSSKRLTCCSIAIPSWCQTVAHQRLRRRRQRLAVGVGVGASASAAEELPPPRPQALGSAAAKEAAVVGKSFFCTGCGKCCTGGGDVWLEDHEVAAAAAHLGLSPERFARRYVRDDPVYGAFRMLKTKPGRQGGEVCVFLDETTNYCKVYEVRPLQCSTYPWWPELLNREDWMAERDHRCEGIEHEDASPLGAGSAEAAHAVQQLDLAVQHTIRLNSAEQAYLRRQGQQQKAEQEEEGRGRGE